MDIYITSAEEEPLQLSKLLPTMLDAIFKIEPLPGTQIAQFQRVESSMYYFDH